ncbi:MAG: hypothetical protein HC804_07900 [Anaerolineae bacterium]|nr:hypothetical protein [Anaerolineae bacterium]
MNRRAFFLIFCLVVLNLIFVSGTLAGLNYFMPRPNRELPTPSPDNGRDTAVYQFPNRPPQSIGGGEWLFPDDHISDEQRQQIETILAANIARLEREGILSASYAPETVPFTWPVQPAPTLHDFGYHGIANFVDNNPNYPYQRRDYACGERPMTLAVVITTLAPTSSPGLSRGAAWTTMKCWLWLLRPV